jgi:hypothetical protein
MSIINCAGKTAHLKNYHNTSFAYDQTAAFSTLYPEFQGISHKLNLGCYCPGMSRIQAIHARNWVHGNDIAETTLPLGMHVTTGADGRRTIDLFTLPNPAADSMQQVRLSHSLLNLCQGILKDHLSGDGDVADFDWRLSACGGTTDITFEKHNGFITGVTCSNRFVIKNSFMTAPLEHYQAALDSPEQRDTILSDGHPERYIDMPMHKIIVPLPLHPAGHIMLDPANNVHPDDPDNEVVFADSQKLIALLRRQENSAPSPYGLPFDTTIEESIDRINPLNGGPGQTPDVRYYPKICRVGDTGLLSMLRNVFATADKPSDALGYVNGYHRTINMVRLGAPFIPLTMPRGPDTESFKKQYGWIGDAAPVAEPVMNVNRSP